MRSRRLALATGLTYHLLEWGPNDDRPGEADHTIVLVHGFLDLAFAWAKVAERLAARFHVIAPDLRGHGDSDWIGAGGYYHFMDYVADLDDVIARAARPRVSVVGHSMGGSVAAYWAGARADRVHRVALLEGLGPPEAQVPPPARTAAWIDAWKQARAAPPRVMASVDEAAARIKKNDPLLDLADALALARHGTRPIGDAGGVRWKHDPLHLTAGPYLYRVDVAEAFWRRIAGPVLYVSGEQSTLRLPDPEVAKRLAVFGEARHVVIAGAGHALQRHKPAEVARVLAEHVGAGVPSAG